MMNMNKNETENKKTAGTGCGSDHGKKKKYAPDYGRPVEFFMESEESLPGQKAVKNEESLLTLREENDQFVWGVLLRNSNAPDFGNTDFKASPNQEAAQRNRELLAMTSLPLTNWTCARQAHTNHSEEVRAVDRGKGFMPGLDAIDQTDALYTTEPETAIGVFTADCVGIILLDPVTPSAAVIHSGWKGTAKAIALHTVQEMKKKGILHPERAEAWFSPSLLKETLEVGLEVKEAVTEMGKRENLDPAPFFLPHPDSEKIYLDNQGLCAAMLEKEGFLPENIHLSSRDTRLDPSCFSYRRDGLVGEHLTYVWIK